jgi:hypothetical protein
VRRRAFITLLGGAVVWPLAARAQQPAMAVVGYLGAGSPTAGVQIMTALRQSLAEAGYVDGRNVAIEFWSRSPRHGTPPISTSCAKGCGISATSKDKTSSSNIGRPMVGPSDSRTSRRNWLVLTWT